MVRAAVHLGLIQGEEVYGDLASCWTGVGGVWRVLCCILGMPVRALALAAAHDWMLRSACYPAL